MRDTVLNMWNIFFAKNPSKNLHKKPGSSPENQGEPGFFSSTVYSVAQSTIPNKKFVKKPKNL